VRRVHGLAIGQPTAEELKLAIGSAGPLPTELFARVRGRELVSGLPSEVRLTSEEARDALAEPVQAVVDAVRSTLDRTPPELASDILTNGILLAGGGAMLHGLADRIHEETQMPTYIADSALTCVAEGAGQALEEFEVIARRQTLRRDGRPRARAARRRR
jgi:rod shape-determining protein MreB